MARKRRPSRKKSQPIVGHGPAPLDSIARVQWIDAAVDVEADIPIGQKPPGPFRCTTVGFLAHVDQESVSVAQDRYQARHAQEPSTYQTVVQIPRRMVSKIEVLARGSWKKVSLEKLKG